MNGAAKTLTAAVLLLAAGACTKPQPDEGTEQFAVSKAWTSVGMGTSVVRIVDKENGVICYVSDGYRSGGIACLRLAQ